MSRRTPVVYELNFLNSDGDPIKSENLRLHPLCEEIARVMQFDEIAQEANAASYRARLLRPREANRMMEIESEFAEVVMPFHARMSQTLGRTTRAFVYVPLLEVGSEGNQGAAYAR
ncbi:MAG TPA: hypothetical protein VHB72_04585 [Candidatus Saccharimonadales bacterium]|nr:hypothetical protein [Candidatus Saccharimonadales bacterium]